MLKDDIMKHTEASMVFLVSAHLDCGVDEAPSLSNFSLRLFCSSVYQQLIKTSYITRIRVWKEEVPGGTWKRTFSRFSGVDNICWFSNTN